MATPVLLLRLHAVVVLVVFLFLGYKLLLLLTGRREQLRHLRARTRWADSLLLGLLLISGGAVWAVDSGRGVGFPIALLGTLLLLVAYVWTLRREKWHLALGDLLGAAVLYGATLYRTFPALLPGLAAPAATSAPAPGLAEATATPDAVAPVDSTTMAANSSTSVDSAQAPAADTTAAPVPVQPSL
ncbi:hypothetical protein [Hymenobacter pini]|uniref:hypothetical protein n=1 Tax=Hymenobacter pini TaxID=2880879 RepID=UPI001CF12FBB|nr:hypothetical protein [Hymenobacter pini]MCA8832028.1 hypothetical protein [Hymenobacter pini]